MNNHFMDIALNEARNAEKRGEVPVGAVVTFKGQVLAKAGNRTLELDDPTAHAEVLAIRQTCLQLKTQRLPDCDLYVTLEPCTMCATVISFARIRRLYFGAEDTKGGAVINGVQFYQQPTCHHRPDIYPAFAEEECRQLLQTFFRTRR